MVFCHNCGQKNNDESTFCINCGTKLLKDSIKCQRCGELNESDSKFCINCGNQLKLLDDNKPRIQRNSIESSANGTKKEINEPTPKAPPLISNEFYIRKVTPMGKKLKKELKEVDRLATRESELLDKLGDKEYYGSEKSKEEFKEFNEYLNNYLEANPKDFITRGARQCGLTLDAIFYSNEDEIKIYELMGKGLYYEDLKEYDKAITLYEEAYNLDKIVHKDAIEKLVRENGEKDYLFGAKAKSRIRICQGNKERDKIKKLEAEAKELEETNPAEAIKKYEHLNKINPGLKKYDRTIFKIYEAEAKELEKTDLKEAIKKYEELNILNPGLKKYNKRIEILKRKLD